MRAIAEDPDGGRLDARDRAVYELAAKVATDAASVEHADVDRLRATGLSDADVADVVFAAAARSFFTRCSTVSARGSTGRRRRRSRPSCGRP